MASNTQGQQGQPQNPKGQQQGDQGNQRGQREQSNPGGADQQGRKDVNPSIQQDPSGTREQRDNEAGRRDRLQPDQRK